MALQGRVWGLPVRFSFVLSEPGKSRKPGASALVWNAEPLRPSAFPEIEAQRTCVVARAA